MKTILLTLLTTSLYLHPIAVSAKQQNVACQQANAIYKKNRQEQRAGYSLRRGNWLNCIEDRSNDAKRKYCKRPPKKINTNTSVRQEIEKACKEDGIPRR